MGESGADVLSGLGVGESPGSLVLQVLEPVQGFARHPEQDSITVIQMEADACMEEDLSY